MRHRLLVGGGLQVTVVTVTVSPPLSSILFLILPSSPPLSLLSFLSFAFLSFPFPLSPTTGSGAALYAPRAGLDDAWLTNDVWRIMANF